ncbi:MAG: hypothetical protein ACR2GZ_12640 [Solirubrobacteraceae bacterium]
MREGLRAAGLALGVIGFGVLSGAAAAASQAGVTPAPGHPHTRFAISFHTQMATGMFAGIRRTDQVSVKGPRRSGCVGSASAGVGTQPANSLVKVHLSPGSVHHWCTGRFHGEVVQFQSIICGPPRMIVCPQLVIAPQTIARLHFRVR